MSYEQVMLGGYTDFQAASENRGLLRRNRPIASSDQTMQQNNERPADEWATTLESIAENQDREAFTRLFRHFAPKIKAYALALNSVYTSPEMADELVQDLSLIHI